MTLAGRLALVLALLMLSTAAHAQQFTEVEFYRSKVDEADDEIVELRNGAIVEMDRYLSYVGYGREAILFVSDEARCELWVEGKSGLRRCTILRAPQYGRPEHGVLDVLSRVAGSGDILVMASGLVLDVSFQSYETMLWIPGATVVLTGTEVINVDEGSEVVTVFPR